MKQKTLLNSLKIILPLGLGIYLVWYFFHNMSDTDEALFYSSIKKANYFWILLSILLCFLSNLSRAYRWKYVLEPVGYKSKFWNRYHAIMIGYLINFTIPRAGEASRAVSLQRADNVPFSTGFGTIITERIVDLIMLIGLTLLTAYLCLEDFNTIKDLVLNKFGAKKSAGESNYQILWILLALFAIGAVVLWKFNTLRIKIFNFIKEIFLGFFSIFKLKQPLGYIFHSIFIWGCYIAMFWVCLYALPETYDFPVKGVFMGFLAGSVGIIFTNGGMGIYPILVGFVIAHYLGDKPDSEGIGNALGMIIWSSQTISFIIFGLISLYLIPKKYAKTNEQN
jgi:glycosyltransferase 2 family protein